MLLVDELKADERVVRVLREREVPAVRFRCDGKAAIGLERKRQTVGTGGDRLPADDTADAGGRRAVARQQRTLIEARLRSILEARDPRQADGQRFRHVDRCTTSVKRSV
ncbi:MAG: hypothetical protein ABSB70_08840 [Candidatus Velthaea sp.]